MRATLFLLLTTLLLFAAQAGASSTAPTLDAAPVSWQEGGTRKSAWLALDELAVLGMSDPGLADGDAIARSIVTDGQAAETNRRYTLVKTAPAPDREAHLARLATTARSSGGKRLGLVLYTSPEARPETRSVITEVIVVRFDEATTSNRIREIERDCAVERESSLDFIPGAHLYHAADPWQALEAAGRLAATAGVLYAYPDRIKPAKPRAGEDPLFPNQWHLANTGQNAGTPGADLNVTPAWAANVLGTHNEVIAIVEPGGVELGHEDLAPNVVPGLSWDFTQGDADTTNPGPGNPGDDSHGTSCAGIAAGRGFNGIGIQGVAPEAGLTAFQIGDSVTDSVVAQALTRSQDSVDIYSNSWGPADIPHLEGMGPLTRDAVVHGATAGRGGLGVIYTWAGGNGGASVGNDNGDNSNYDGYANNRYVIAAAASNRNGVRSAYSEKGANLLVNTPSSNAGAGDIWTTDHTGGLGFNAFGAGSPQEEANEKSSSTNYTSTFGGTSATAPMLAGAVALMLQANPDLTWRDVQHVLARSARKNDPNDPDWIANGAGFLVNHKYGFGRVDASAATTLAATWTSVGPESFTLAGAEPNLPIPDNNATGVSSTIQVADDVTLDFVEVTFSAPDHTYWGDLEIVLTAPSGTRSVLAETHSIADLTSYDHWRFGSRRHLGEGSKGTWTLTVRDKIMDEVGTFTHWGLKFYGTAISLSPPMAGIGVSQTSPLTSRFSDTSTGQIVSWQWNFGDGRTSTVQHPIHTYSSPGTYNVTLTVTGRTAAGQTETSTVTRAVAVSNTSAEAPSSAGNGATGGSSSGGGGGCTVGHTQDLALAAMAAAAIVSAVMRLRRRR